MRIASFVTGSRESYGVVSGAGLIDAGMAFRGDLPTLRAVLAAGALADLAAWAAGRSPDLALEDVSFRPTIPDAGKIICIGVNYGERNAEYRDGSETPRYPSVFLRTRESVVGHREPILRPPESEQLDYEGEIALVIGRPGRRIAAADAIGHVAGLTLMNEGTIRDWLRHAKFNVTPGKNFERSGSMGPWLVTVDEFGPLDALHLTTRVNGELRQDDTTANLLFPFARLIEYLSSFMPLAAGDVIATGTPTGAGARFDPPRYLKPGDVVEVSVPEIGTLSNVVRDE
jgi:2-keto-4-pentenoate hydratase/2-oxohepta-3-ene-1,7-dioic acid hydratase in catechol pathway